MPDQSPNPRLDLQRIADEMIAELTRSGAVPGIEIGAQAPSFTLTSATGDTVSLEDRLAEGPVVLVFYRGAWCPVCSLHLAALRESLGEIQALGASLIAVSPQAPDDSLSFAERLDLGFDVLSDVDQAVIKAYRLQFELSEQLRDVYQTMNMGLDVHNADGTWNLPVPASFVIDRLGTVRARHVDANYRERMDPGDMITALRSLD